MLVGLGETVWEEFKAQNLDFSRHCNALFHFSLKLMCILDGYLGDEV